MGAASKRFGWVARQGLSKGPAVEPAPGGRSAAKSACADSELAIGSGILRKGDTYADTRSNAEGGVLGEHAGEGAAARGGWGVDALVLAGAYLYGSLPLVYLMGRGRQVDLKQVGSGNVGATNLMAVSGPARAAAGWIFDASKGVLPVLAARRLGRREEVAELAGVCGVAGQCWPLFLGFQGGRGISAYVGATGAICWRAWPAALVPMIVGGMWRVAPKLARRGQSTRNAGAVRSKSMPLGCFVSMVTYPMARGVLGGSRRGKIVAPTLLSVVVLARRLTASLPDDATEGPKAHPRALLYRLLYDRNTSV